ncbi:MAG: glutamate synthase subunit alpha, partial [Dehalococcoidia bacterium]|nr:glutamate synthase subunit alpha [Dehalococcoidia bacterium]
PAALAFSDGVVAAAVLDRNGLRPARYVITDAGLVVLGSEVGMVQLDPASIVEKGRLAPGEMIAVDTAGKRLLRNHDIKAMLASQQPYGEWVRANVVALDLAAARASNGHVTDSAGAMGPATAEEAEKALLQRQAAFGYTAEEVRQIIQTMGAEAADPTWSMGDDTPLAVLSEKPRSLFNYFRQRFAQVTNPPIDPLREQLVMALNGYVGARRSFLEETAEHARLVYLPTPVLLDAEVDALRRMGDPAFRAATLSAVFPVGDGPDGLSAALDAICSAAERAVDEGASILIVSDRAIDERHAPIPSLLAVGAVHHHLIRVGRRMMADLIVESGDCFDVHHVATLIGYGASAVNPYLALATVRALHTGPEFAADAQSIAMENYRHACEKALLKICSKMGI